MSNSQYNNEFKIVSEHIMGDVTITENVQFNYITAETVIVAEGVRARLYGSVSKKLVVKKNARIFIHGNVTGEVIDEGGRIFIFNTE